MSTAPRTPDPHADDAKARRQARRQATIDHWLEPNGSEADFHPWIPRPGPYRTFLVAAGMGEVITDAHHGAGLTLEDVVAWEASHFAYSDGSVIEAYDVFFHENGRLIATVHVHDGVDGSYTLERFDAAAKDPASAEVTLEDARQDAALRTEAETAADGPQSWQGHTFTITNCEATLNELFEQLRGIRLWRNNDSEHYNAADQSVYKDGRLVAILRTIPITERMEGSEGNLELVLVDDQVDEVAAEATPAITREQAHTELAEAVAIARADNGRPERAPRPPRQFDSDPVIGVAHSLLRDMADVLLTAISTQTDAAKIQPELEGAELAIVDAIRDSAWTVAETVKQALARTAVLLWQRSNEFREPHASFGPAKWEPCAAILDQFVVSVTPGLEEGVPQNDTEAAEVVVVHREDFRSDKEEAAFLRTLPRRTVDLSGRRAKVVTPEEMAAAVLA